MLEGVIPLETFLLVEWHQGELADVLSFTVLKTQICVTRPQCIKNMDDRLWNLNRDAFLKLLVRWSWDTENNIDRDIIQVSSKDSQVKTQLVLWIFILFKVTR